MFLLLKELLPPDGLPARTHPLGRGVFNETPSHNVSVSCPFVTTENNSFCYFLLFTFCYLLGSKFGSPFFHWNNQNSKDFIFINLVGTSL